MFELDFGYGSQQIDNNQGATDDNDKGQGTEPINNGNEPEPPADIDGTKGNEPVDIDGGTKPKDNTDTDDKGDKDENLTPGTSIEFDGKTYTVDDNGNVIDSEGNIFKEAKDVKSWMETLDVSDKDDTKTSSLKSIQESLGISITDENDRPVEYEDTPEGIAAYVKDAIEVSKEEHYDTALNTLFTRYPFINDMINYYEANGHSLEGFDKVPDRSGIEIDSENQTQQESIIRIAWEERGTKGDVNAYIEFLKSNGTLEAVAKEELQALQDADAAYKKQIEDEAKKQQEEQENATYNYWLGVKQVIDTRKIAGYQIPDNIIINRNGQKVSVTPNDFFNYLYRVDTEGKSMYVRDLEKETPESRRDDEILRAYLKFVGGNYSNLIDMAINEQKVKTLRLSSKQNDKPKVTITKPSKANTGKDINFGY